MKEVRRRVIGVNIVYTKSSTNRRTGVGMRKVKDAKIQSQQLNEGWWCGDVVCILTNKQVAGAFKCVRLDEDRSLSYFLRLCFRAVPLQDNDVCTLRITLFKSSGDKPCAGARPTFKASSTRLVPVHRR